MLGQFACVSNHCRIAHEANESQRKRAGLTRPEQVARSAHLEVSLRDIVSIRAASSGFGVNQISPHSKIVA